MVRSCANGRKRRRETETIANLRAGRGAQISAEGRACNLRFVQELYKTRRVSDRTYKRVHSLLGDQATVELVGISAITS